MCCCVLITIRVTTLYKNTFKTIAIIGMILLPDIYLFASEKLTIGVFPRRNTVITVKMFSPMIQHIEAETGIKLQLETAKNFAEFWRRVKQNRYDIVHFNQLHYVLSTKFGYEAFAKNEEFGSSSIAPAIVVRKDGGIDTIADLKNKTVMFGGGKLALVSYIGNRMLMMENGIEADDSKVVFARNPPNATMAVYLGQADAAGVGNMGLEIPSIRKKINTDELKYLAIGHTFPHLPWAFSKKVTKQSKQKIKDSFFALGSSKVGTKLLKKAGLTRILSANDKEYSQIRVFYNRFLELTEKTDK